MHHMGCMASPEPYMVQGKPSPLPAPRLRQAGVERGRRFSTFYDSIRIASEKEREWGLGIGSAGSQ